MLCRYMNGVYYLPKITVSGIPFTLSADKVAELKYVSNNSDAKDCLIIIADMVL